jgi:hypothetical protein
MTMKSSPKSAKVAFVAVDDDADVQSLCSLGSEEMDGGAREQVVVSTVVARQRFEQTQCSAIMQCVM